MLDAVLSGKDRPGEPDLPRNVTDDRKPRAFGSGEKCIERDGSKARIDLDEVVPIPSMDLDRTCGVGGVADDETAGAGPTATMRSPRTRTVWCRRARSVSRGITATSTNADSSAAEAERGTESALRPGPGHAASERTTAHETTATALRSMFEITFRQEEEQGRMSLSAHSGGASMRNRALLADRAGRAGEEESQGRS